MNFKIERIRLHNACPKAIKAMSFTQQSGINKPLRFLFEADCDAGTLKLTGANHATDMPITSIVIKLKNVCVFESGNAVVPAKQFTNILNTSTAEIVMVAINNSVDNLTCDNQPRCCRYKCGAAGNTSPFMTNLPVGVFLNLF